MGFLVPAFLLGAAALAIPVIVHLIHRQKTDATPFPSLMFVARIPHKSVERRRIRNWPLFALRCLALLLIVVAFARPFAERDVEAAGALGLAREVVIVLDHSHSMSLGERWPRALEAARAAIAQVRQEDRATLVVFGRSAAALTETTDDRARLLRALEGVEPTGEGTRYGPALRLAHSIVARSELPRARIVLISDMQRYGWDAETHVVLPHGAELQPVHVGEASVPVTVTDVSYDRATFAGRERITPRVAVHRFADPRATPAAADPRATPGADSRATPAADANAAIETRVTLELDGRALETRAVSLREGASAAVEFTTVTVPDVGGRFVARIEGAGAGDALRFSVVPDGELRVLILESGAGAAPSLYVERALAIGGWPGYAVERRSVAQFRAADLDGRHAVILNDAPFPGGEAGRALARWVREGGGLVVALGERGGGGWTGEAAALLPGTIGRVVDRLDAGGARFGWIDASHAALEPIGGTGFGAARFYRYRPIEGAAGEHVIARFDDGRVALAGHDVGTGRVLLFASSLDVSWNDLALQPVFLPLVHRLVAHAAAWQHERDWFTVGDVVPVPVAAVAGRGDAAPTVTAPDGRRARLEDGWLRLEQAGFYEVRRGEERWHVAANVDRAEYDPATLGEADVHARIARAAAPDDATRAAGVLNPVRDEHWERRQAFWWYLLVVALLLLALESVLSGRLTRRPAVSSS
jgi:hypothetical protein